MNKYYKIGIMKFGVWEIINNFFPIIDFIFYFGEVYFIKVNPLNSLLV